MKGEGEGEREKEKKREREEVREKGCSPPKVLSPTVNLSSLIYWHTGTIEALNLRSVNKDLSHPPNSVRSLVPYRAKLYAQCTVVLAEAEHGDARFIMKPGEK